MRYKILFTKNVGSQKQITVVDFSEGATIEFTLEELDQLDEELQLYVKSIEDKIKSDYFKYTL